MKRIPQRVTLALITSAVLFSSAAFLFPSALAKQDKYLASIPRPKGKSQPAETKARLGSRLQRSLAQNQKGKRPENIAGMPNVLDTRAPFSAEVVTSSSVGAAGFFSDLTQLVTLANNDGREDFTADRAQLMLNPVFPGPNVRTAVSEHTYANGFGENAYYFGDSFGQFSYGIETVPGPGSPNESIDTGDTITISELVNTGSSAGVTLVQPNTLNPVIGQCTSDFVTITGIAVNPVADLSDFGEACGTIGEVVYVSTLDPNGCSANAVNQATRTHIFAFGFVDGTGASAVTPVANALLIYSSPQSNSGVTVDDDGNLY